MNSISVDQFKQQIPFYEKRIEKINLEISSIIEKEYCDLEIFLITSFKNEILNQNSEIKIKQQVFLLLLNPKISPIRNLI